MRCRSCSIHFANTVRCRTDRQTAWLTVARLHIHNHVHTASTWPHLWSWTTSVHILTLPLDPTLSCTTSYYFVPTWLRPSDYSFICIVICVGVTCFGEHKNVDRILLLYSLAHSQYILWLILYGFRISFFRSVLLTSHFLLLQIPLSFYRNMPLKVGDSLSHVSWCSNFLGKKIGPLRDNEFQATAT